MLNVMVLKDAKLTEKEIDDTLEALQEEVGGWIDIPYLSEELNKVGIDVIINDEGKLIGLDPELVLFYENEIADIVCGNILFASHDEEGNTVGLSEEQKLHIMKNLYVGNWALNLMFGKEVAFINI